MAPQTQTLAEIGEGALGVETAKVPGDISCAGLLQEATIAQLAPKYKAWLHLNSADHPDFYPAAIEAGGCVLTSLHLPGDGATEEHARELVRLVGTLPRPLMLQCSTGKRASATLLLWLAMTGGHNAESAAQLAKDMNLKFFSQGASGPLWDWLAAQIGASQVQGKSAADCKCMVEQLFDTQGSSTYTYALGDPSTQEAVLVDPVLGMQERDLALLEERGYTLKYVVNTHCHADHVTSGKALKALGLGVRTVIAEATGAQADWLLREGDRVEFGSFALEALATPGHTAGCLSFVLRGPGDPKCVFTGDALLIRGCGRTDFQEGDAATLYNSIHSKIFSLPDDTKVYPGHDYKGRNLSTVLEEKTFNPRLTKSKQDFVQLMADLGLPYPKLIDVALPANLADGAQQD